MCLNDIYSTLNHLLSVYPLPQLVIYYLLCIYWNIGIYGNLLRMLFIVVDIYYIYSVFIHTLFNLYFIVFIQIYLFLLD